MIGIITFIVSLLIFGVLFGAFKGSTYAGEPDKYGDVRLKPLGIIKAVTTVLIAFIMKFQNFARNHYLTEAIKN